MIHSVVMPSWVVAHSQLVARSMAHCTRGLLLTEPMGGVLTLIPLAAPRGVLRGGMKTDGTPECQLSGWIVRDASCRSAAPIRESVVPCLVSCLAFNTRKRVAQILESGCESTRGIASDKPIGWSVNTYASCRSAAPIRESVVPCLRGNGLRRRSLEG